jgi:hypothetical protein
MQLPIVQDDSFHNPLDTTKEVKYLELYLTQLERKVDNLELT